jgi:hypothetical protein
MFQRTLPVSRLTSCAFIGHRYAKPGSTGPQAFESRAPAGTSGRRRSSLHPIGSVEFNSWAMAVMIWDGANGFWIRMLLGTPCEVHSSDAAPVM